MGGSIIFNQAPNGNAGTLWVNDSVGSSTQPLANYAKIVTPFDSTNTNVDTDTIADNIEIEVALNGGDAVVLAGVAIRLASLPPLVVDNTADTGVFDHTDGMTLREAINLANDFPGADQISFNLPAGQQTINVGQQLEITDPLTITGPGADLLTLDGQNNSRIFNITDTAGNVTLAGMTLIGGNHATGSGGAISSQAIGTLTISGSTLRGNSAANGGAIFGAEFSERWSPCLRAP